MANKQDAINIKKPSVGIIGCGWLGLALAKKCLEKSINVIATTQSETSLTTVKAHGLHGHLLSLPLAPNDTNQYAVFDQDILIVCFPPKLRNGQKNYVQKIKNIVKFSKNSHVRKVVLISTTAVYQGHTGEVDENTPLKLDIEKVAILAQAEQQICSINDDCVVLRCAGLVGPERYPGNFFTKGKVVKSPNAYVNLVHQFDVVEQIFAFITQQLPGGIYNCVSEMQVTKQHFYEIAAKLAGKPSPVFDQLSELDLGKYVLANKLRQISPVQHQYDDLIAWLSTPQND
ncbi:NAD(P)-binding domain-containing protein [Thalassotalea sp. 1_MG-2023]|uniref:NAD(P)H-binding protein n=1 Tax=Thalassotalea sp. 1_MG-2023 TaxID=3062680 RepID=UPI0026E3CE0A|nr:NAD(P)H-binding protein [Thalassotalea sp. 1_MG-2023]MDO6426164.1 NAD(P)-binding domain-containing protein [Thalassotalea sp. 1_MG-2023]